MASNRGERGIAGFLDGLLQGAVTGLQLRRQRQLDEDQRKRDQLTDDLARAREERAVAGEKRDVIDFETRQEAAVPVQVESAKQRIAIPIDQQLEQDASVLERGKQKLERDLPGIPGLTERERGALTEDELARQRLKDFPPQPRGGAFDPAKFLKDLTATTKTNITNKQKIVDAGGSYGGRGTDELPPGIIAAAESEAQDVFLQTQNFTTGEAQLPVILGGFWAGKAFSPQITEVNEAGQNVEVPNPLGERLSSRTDINGEQLTFESPFIQSFQIADILPEGIVDDNQLLSAEDIAIAMAQIPNLKEQHFIGLLERILEGLELAEAQDITSVQLGSELQPRTVTGLLRSPGPETPEARENRLRQRKAIGRLRGFGHPFGNPNQ